MSRKARRLCALLVMCIGFGLSGCVWKSEHIKIVTDLQGQLKKLNQENDDLQAKLVLSQKNLDKTNKALLRSRGHAKSLASQKRRLEKQLAELTAAKEQCMENVRSLAAKRGELGAKLQNAIVQIERLQQLARERQALFDRLRDSLKNLVQAGKLKVSMRNGMFVLELAENILFDSGRAQVKGAGRQAIDEVTRLLVPTQRRWQVTGHTDDRGNASFNWNLSTQRALAVLMVMLKAGMPPEMVSAAGFGQYQPSAANDSSENRALNRRTEIVLVPNLQELKLAENASPFWICQEKTLASR